MMGLELKQRSKTMKGNIQFIIKKGKLGYHIYDKKNRMFFAKWYDNREVARKALNILNGK
jgi:hypothetical protein